MIDPIQILSLHHRIAPSQKCLGMRSEDRVNQSTQPRRDFLLSCASNLHLAKSAIGKNTLRATARLLNGKSTAGVTAALASCGCLSESNPERPQKVWGRRGFSPGRFLKPRAITIDEQDRLYIVDTTGRIQVFDTEGNFLHQWKTPQTQNGRPTGLAFGAGQKRSASTKSSEVQHDRDGNDPRIFVADTHYYRMLSYTLKGEPVTDESIGASPVLDPVNLHSSLTSLAIVLVAATSANTMPQIAFRNLMRKVTFCANGVERVGTPVALFVLKVW